MLVERLEILEDLGETLPPDAGCLIRILGCRPTERVIILGTHRQRFSALGMDQATVLTWGPSVAWVAYGPPADRRRSTVFTSITSRTLPRWSVTRRYVMHRRGRHEPTLGDG